MRAAVVRQWGAPESITIEELADPEPGPGEVVQPGEWVAVLGGADVVVDPVGGSYSEDALRATHFGFRCITVGYPAGIPRIPLNLVLLKGVRVLGYEARTFGVNAPELLARDREELQQLYESARVAPYIGATFDLDDVAAALRLMGDRGAIGKIIVHPWTR